MSLIALTGLRAFSAGTPLNFCRPAESLLSRTFAKVNQLNRSHLPPCSSLRCCFSRAPRDLLFSTANVIRSEVPLHDVDTLLMSKIGDPQSRPFVASSP